MNKYLESNPMHGTSSITSFQTVQTDDETAKKSSTTQSIKTNCLILIVLLGAFFRFYQLGAFSVGNSYYAATVQSMLISWHNFFFAAFEPGGSISVDKPPLGFWFQAISAYFLGVNGFSLALPQVLAGVLSILLLYAIVKRQFGCWAGLIASFMLAIMPVTIVTERNNTIGQIRIHYWRSIFDARKTGYR